MNASPDYFSLLTRAVATLEEDTPEARKELYDRAQKALVEQLRGRGAAEHEIMREQRTLAAAIDRVEDAKNPDQQQSSAAEAQQLAGDGPINQTPPSASQAELGKSVLSIIDELLAPQLITGCNSPQHAAFIIFENMIASGYVFGFYEAFLQRYGLMDIEDPASALKIIHDTYQNMFGTRGGNTLFAVGRSSRKNPDFQKGRLSGGQEAIDFIDQGIPPLSLGRILKFGHEN